MIKSGLSFFRKVFTRIEERSFRLRFEMDTDAEGKHHVRVYKVKEGQEELIKKPFELLDYGYREVAAEGNREIHYSVSPYDTQTLLALEAHNPRRTKAGELVFDVMPHTLRFLRGQKNLEEGEGSKEIQILNDPIKPVANVTYNPFEGLHVEAGYALEEDPETLVPLGEIEGRIDHGYLRIGKTFTPVQRVSHRLGEILGGGKKTIPPKHIPEFIVRDLVLLKKECNAVLTEFVRQIYVVNDSYRPHVRVDKKVGGWLDFQISYLAGGIEFPHELLKVNKDDEYVQVNAFTWVKVDKQALNATEKALEKIEADIHENGYRLPAHEFLSLEGFIEEIGGNAALSEAYQVFLDRLTGFLADENYHLGDKLETDLARQNLQLRPYQRSGIHWLDWLRTNHLQGILADDMGLGKTLQALCTLRLGYESSDSTQHSLVIAPKSVLHHWERELARCFPSMKAYVYHGSNRRASVFRAKTPHVVITTFDLVARDLGTLIRVPFFYLIVDEATKIKNPDARRTQAIKSLNALHRLALSGTPVENRPSELWSLFDFLMKGHLGKYNTFIRVYEDQILRGERKAVENLGRKVKPFLLRRKKEDVAKDLPEKLEMTDWVELTGEQAQLYGSLQDTVNGIRSSLNQGEYVNVAANILPVLTKLKQICNHPGITTQNLTPIHGRSEKFDWIVDKIDEILEAGEQVVLFSHFLGMLHLFEIALRERGVQYMRIDGGTDNRQFLIDEFNKGRYRVGLLSLMAAGHGINLTGANHVIHADRWWNPAVEDQATDRVHRIGQDKKVYVYNVIVQNTIEERIEQLLYSKRDMADRILDAATTGERSWSREEILALLKPFD